MSKACWLGDSVAQEGLGDVSRLIHGEHVTRRNVHWPRLRRLGQSIAMDLAIYPHGPFRTNAFRRHLPTEEFLGYAYRRNTEDHSQLARDPEPLRVKDSISVVH